MAARHHEPERAWLVRGARAHARSTAGAVVVAAVDAVARRRARRRRRAVAGPAVRTAKDLRSDWLRVIAARRAVSDAGDIRARLHALFHFQGELVRFVERHWAAID